jgi:hypothetical protein
MSSASSGWAEAGTAIDSSVTAARQRARDIIRECSGTDIGRSGTVAVHCKSILAISPTGSESALNMLAGGHFIHGLVSAQR